MFRTKAVEKIKTHFVSNNFFFFRKSCPSWDNVEKIIVELCNTQMTVRRMRIACRIPKATNTHSEYVILIAFNCNSGCTNAPQCYVTRTLQAMLFKQRVFVLRFVRWRYDVFVLQRCVAISNVADYVLKADSWNWLVAGMVAWYTIRHSLYVLMETIACGHCTVSVSLAALTAR
jgi:hypothetical protein